MKLNRYQAFATHLVGSVAVALCSAALVFLVWYPDKLPQATGVTNIFLMLLAIDVLVGPVVTLIVFNTAKKELKRDLLIVLLLQLGALAYGLHAVFIARPAYSVFSVDRFELVLANDLTDDKLKKVTDARYKSPPCRRE
jgi:F0F1-type ATP synthase assembly protein I